jgi:hypothetical protein
MGIDFFRKAIAFQEKYRKPGMTFENTPHFSQKAKNQGID